MTVTAAFNGTSSEIRSNTGTDFTHDVYTIAALVYNTSATSQRSVVNFANGSNSNPRLVFDSTTNIAVEHDAGDFPFWGSVASSSSWHLVVITKATGTVAPKLYLTKDGSTWTPDGAAADAGTAPNPPSTISDVWIGDSLGAAFWNGEIAVVALANTEANSSTVHGLTNFNNWASLTNLRYFTGDSLINAGTINDTGSGNNDETSRANVSTGSQAVPSWFTNFGANLGTLGRPTRLIEFVKAVGTVTNTTGGTTSAITVASGGVPVGNSVVIVGSHDNSNTSPAGGIQTVTISDTRSNTWNYCTHAIADPGAANAGQEGWIAWTNVTTAMQASDTITITYAVSVTAKAIRADEFENMGGLVTQATQDNQTAQSVSVAVTPTGVGQLVIGGVAVEGGTADAFTQDTDTTNGSWVNPGRLGSGTTTSGATLNPVYKIVTAPGVQTYDHATMLGTSRDHCAMLAVFSCLPYDVRPDSFGRHRGRARVRRR